MNLDFFKFTNLANITKIRTRTERKDRVVANWTRTGRGDRVVPNWTRTGREELFVPNFLMRVGSLFRHILFCPNIQLQYSVYSS